MSLRDASAAVVRYDGIRSPISVADLLGRSLKAPTPSSGINTLCWRWVMGRSFSQAKRL
jgi:hypothetical protein